ncbi:conserved membrane hypothetical protein [Burkholderiales bacterium 8X]|nr:conserved membrane hypothetical protein [Burkholderiales bacterium 8X]
MKLNSIQYLRGLAAIAVLLAHTLLQPLAEVNQQYVRFGTFGVLLFFVISGFIMIYITGKERFSPLSFLARRAERIVPLYWVATIAVALVAASTPSLLKNTVFSFPNLAYSLLFIPHFRSNGEIAPLLKLGWTLNYEVFFYLIFAATALLSIRLRLVAIALIFLAIISIGKLFTFDSAIGQFYTQPVILAFAAGMIVGFIQIDYPSSLTSHWMRASSGAIAVLFLTLSFFYDQSAAPNPLTDALFTLGAASLVLTCVGFEARMPVSKHLRLIGDASYAIYLSHIYIVVAIFKIAEKLEISFSNALFVCVIVVSLASGTLIHIFIERPIGKFFQRRRKSMMLTGTDPVVVAHK